ncbi:hypothetical protein GCM10011390_16120 [Aureimonas endophytica]|uniref:Uncharacterized protein n=1 Tax=Aureimonas endophytica TaxID=2027858 RepID=A0A916ZHX2_9HYPH|nr:hypothetical protein [Aureimonas endophytica]GGD98116.1 hypothetical protein GCM10011390_16120 [Aureimonas endophytica]
MSDDRLALYGTDEPPAPHRRLRAGRLEADLVAGNLRAIRFAGHEVLRAIAYVVRDRDWGTYDLGIDAPTVAEDAAGFTVAWRAACTAPDGAWLAIEATIRGEASGRLVFEASARPEGDFETNRCGFCILHPIEGVAGRLARVVHTDGSVETARFPDLIEPWQPFKDIAAIRHEPAPGLAALCRMEGDVFEMEDQRAWSDASYKTYVRPLALPWPYRLPVGATMRQRIVLEIEGGRDVPAVAADGAGPVRLGLGPTTGERFPAFGLLVAPDEAGDILAAPDALRDLAPRHLLFHFDPTAGHGAAELARLAAVRALAPGAEAMLECVLPGIGDPGAELRESAALVAASGLDPSAVTVGPSVDRQSTPPGSAWPPCPPLDAVYAAARQAFPGLRLGGGMFSYFTELNRKRPPVGLLDYVTHATCPIVHAADDLSVMQSLEAIPFITRSTRAIIGRDKPYHLGPVTIGMRQNPYGSRTMPNPENRRIAMAAEDPRGRGLFAAAWLVGYAARLAGAGIEAWTGATLAGPRGLIARQGDDTRRHPLFHVAEGMAALSGLPRLALRSAAASRVDGVAAETGDGRVCLWLANLTPEPQRVLLPDLGSAETARLEAGAAGWQRGAAAGPDLTLGPYAVVRVEGALTASTP